MVKKFFQTVSLSTLALIGAPKAMYANNVDITLDTYSSLTYTRVAVRAKLGENTIDKNYALPENTGSFKDLKVAQFELPDTGENNWDVTFRIFYKNPEHPTEEESFLFSPRWLPGTPAGIWGPAMKADLFISGVSGSNVTVWISPKTTGSSSNEEKKEEKKS